MCPDPILVKRLGMFCQMAHSNKEEEVLQKLLELLKSSQEMWQVTPPESVVRYGQNESTLHN